MPTKHTTISILKFFKGCRRPGGSLIYWAHVTSLHVKQMYSQPMHLTHELILCIQTTGGRVDFYGDSTVKSPCLLGTGSKPVIKVSWLILFACDLPTQIFFDLQLYRIWPFSRLHTVGPHYKSYPSIANKYETELSNIRCFLLLQLSELQCKSKLHYRLTNSRSPRQIQLNECRCVFANDRDMWTDQTFQKRVIAKRTIG